MKVVIVGGVAGGASAAARLRRLDETAEIILLERGAYISYANCGLPYYIGGVIIGDEELTLQTPEGFRNRFRVDVRVLNEVLLIQRECKSVQIRDLSIGRIYEETYDKLILSPGAAPITPPIKGDMPVNLFTLRTIPDAMAIHKYIAEHAPQSATVVGGGFIGLEIAENLMARGIDVTILEQANQILPALDYEMACCVEKELLSRGLKLCLGVGVSSIEADGDRIRLETGQDVYTEDMVIFAAGVRPESGLAKAAGLEIGVRGCICVNGAMQTSDPSIYAVGDAAEAVHFVTGAKVSVPLAGPANKQGRLAADNICGIKRRFSGVLGSSIIKLFDFSVASTGINERIATNAGIGIEKVYLSPASNASYYPDCETLAMKVIFEKGSGKVLGAQLFGKKGVDKRCDVLATAIHAKMTADDLAEQELCYAPPFSSAKDPVNMAGFIAQNVLSGTVRQFYWDELERLPTDGSVTLLDVRTVAEYNNGSSKGFINIPVDQLRERMAELPKDKEVYLICQSALRSYIACRILTQEGFRCAHLAGGLFFYSAIRAGESCLQRAFPCGLVRPK